MNRLIRHLKMNLPRYGGEFMIIFFSITLSYWAEDWRQERKDRRTESGHLQNLLANLESDSVLLVSESRGMESSLQRLNELYAKIKSAGANNPVDSLERYIFPLIVVPEFHPAKSEFEAMKSTGGLSLIRDDSLTAELMDLYEVAYGSLDFIINITHTTFQQNSWDHTIQNFDLTVVIGPEPGGTFSRTFTPSERSLILNKVVFCSLALKSSLPRFRDCQGRVRALSKRIRSRISAIG